MATEVNFNAGVVDFLNESIFPPIIAGLAAKGLFVNADELMEIVQSPSINPVTHHAVPAMAFGGMNHPSNAPRTAASTSATATNNITSNPVPGRCIYQFKRGDHKGHYCGKAVAPGNTYCSNCLKTRKISKDSAPPPSNHSESVDDSVPSSQQGGNGQLNVVIHDKERDLYREPTHNFIVRPVGPGTIAVIGKLGEGDRLISLTTEEKSIARNMGLVISDLPK